MSRPARLDHLYDLISLVYIRDKDMNVRPIDLGAPFAWVQREIVLEVIRQYNAGLPVRVIDLKARQVGSCLPPDTPVLTADLRWVPIGSVLPGDELVAVEEEPTGGGRGRGRRLRRTVVEATNDTVRLGYRLTFDTAPPLIVSGDHRLLCQVRGAAHTQWRRVHKMRLGDSVRQGIPVWRASGQYEEGWMGGMIDGEGSLRRKQRAGSELTITQCPGPVYDRMVQYVKSRGYTLREDLDERGPGPTSKLGNRPVAKVVMGRIDEIMQIIGETRPTRFVDGDWWEDKEIPHTGWARIEAIELLDYMDMVDLQTRDRTYMANGLVSHNSTICSAIGFNWLQIFGGCQALQIAHDTETTQSLFEKIQDAWEWWPFRGLRHLRHASARRLTIEETGSSVRIATARNVKSGRGRTIQFLHASEMSQWDDPETLMTGLTKTVPNRHGSCVIIECTANGVGNLYWRMWQAAMAGRNDYVPLFFPWWCHPEYVAERTLLRYVELDEYERWLYDVLFVHGLPSWPWTRGGMPEEERLRRIEFRRWSIANEFEGDVQNFAQEMPATPEEAFLRTGRNRFPLDKLMECYQPMAGIQGYLTTNVGGRVEFVKDPLGPWTIFKWPATIERDFGDYMVAADPTGHILGDPACIQIINRRTYEQVAVYHAQTDAVELAPEIIRAGRYFNDAMVSSEIEGPGYATIGALLAYNYPRIWQHRWADRHPGKLAQNFGWSTNFQRKNLMMENLTHKLSLRAVTIHDRLTYEQMRDYSVINDFGEMGPAAKGGHDDAVMAFAQAVICSVMEGEPPPYTRSPTSGPTAPQPPAPANNDLMGVPPWEAFDQTEATVG